MTERKCKECGTGLRSFAEWQQHGGDTCNIKAAEAWHRRLDEQAADRRRFQEEKAAKTRS